MSNAESNDTPAQRRIHVAPHGEAWAVWREGEHDQRWTSAHRAEATAEACRMAFAEGGVVIVHDAEGQGPQRPEALSATAPRRARGSEGWMARIPDDEFSRFMAEVNAQYAEALRELSQ